MTTPQTPPEVEDAAQTLLDAAMSFQSQDLDDERPRNDAYFEEQARFQVLALIERGWTPPVVSASTEGLWQAIFNVLTGDCDDPDEAVKAVIEAGWRPWMPYLSEAPPRWASGDALTVALFNKAEIGGDCEESEFYISLNEVRAVLAELLPHYQGVAEPPGSPEDHSTKLNTILDEVRTQLEQATPPGPTTDVEPPW